MNNIQQHFFNELVICPNTAQQVSEEQISFQGVLGRMAGMDVWWRCPACNRWHILVIEPERKKKIAFPQ